MAARGITGGVQNTSGEWLSAFTTVQHVNIKELL
jgi:hypothetical protein